jgi:alkylated DNA repair protein alkB homolog 6
MANAIDMKALMAEELARMAGMPARRAPEPVADPIAEHVALREREAHPCIDGDFAIRYEPLERVGPVPDVAVLRDVVSAEYEAELLAAIDSPSYARSKRWVHLRGRDLMQFGGVPLDGPCLEHREPLPLFLDDLVNIVMELGLFPPERRPNHVLVNRYGSGEGILPHTDGGLYWPRTVTISLGSDALLHFTPRVATGEIGTDVHREMERSLSFDVALPRRSLVTFGEAAYTDFLHGIDPSATDEITERCVNGESLGLAVGSVLTRSSVRVSLTFRHVPESS